MTGHRDGKSKVGARVKGSGPVRGYCDVPLTVFAPEDQREALYKRFAAKGGVPQESIENDTFILVQTIDPDVIVRRYMW